MRAHKLLHFAICAGYGVIAGVCKTVDRSRGRCPRTPALPQRWGISAVIFSLGQA